MWRVRGDGVSMERLDGETIVINFDTGEYFSFRGSSADVLWLVDSHVAPEAWGAVLGGSFPGLEWGETAQSEVDAFLEELLTAGLIEHTTAQGTTEVTLPDDYVRSEWTAPSVHANSDLVDLLVIDPIHDTSEDGWPSTRTD